MKNFLACLLFALGMLVVSAAELFFGQNVVISAGSPPPTPDYVWWKFNENTGTSVGDSSTATGNTATLSNAAMWTTGASGSGVAGNGTTYDFASGSTINFSNSTTLTISLSLKSANYAASTAMYLESSATYYANVGCFALFRDTDGKIWIGMSGTTSGIYYGSINAPSTGAFHNLVVVLNQTTPSITAWLDGASTTVTPTNSSFIGATGFKTNTIYGLYRAGGSTSFNNDTIDDVRIWAGDQSSYANYISSHPQ